MKMYLFVWTMPDFQPTYKLFKTRKEAEKELNAAFGEYIIDCIKGKDVDAVMKFIEQFNDSDKNGIYSIKEELYIEELEVPD